MSHLEHLQLLTRYRAWADRRLYQALAALPEHVLVTAQPIVFGSLLRTLNHVYCMDQVWKAHLQGEQHGFTTRNPEDCPPFETLLASQEDIDDWYIRFATSLDDRSCDETVRFTFIGGSEGQMRRADILLHVVNHATYHRGHVAAMMYGVPMLPPTTDLPVFLREAH
ncbi:DinB family protein [Dyella jejuensis]|uniref:DinB family protein n=1 Tax=Dyella jejuensis TaxID=1432009 RepID=A0ABW8JIA1_9GAMM